MLAGKLIRRIGARQIVIALLLLAAAVAVTAGLADLVKGIEDDSFWVIGVSGLVAGWLLAHSRMRGWLAALLGTLAGLLLIVFLLAGLGSPLSALLRSLFYLASDALRWQGPGSLDTTSLFLALQELSSRFNSFATHLYTWLNGILNQQPVLDRTTLTLLWGSLVWLTTLWAAWWVHRRRQPLPAIFPMAAVLAAVLNYTHGNAQLLTPIVVISLGLMGLVSFDNQQRGWLARGVDYAEDVVMDASMTLLFLTLLLTTAAAVAPSWSVRQMVRYGQELYQRIQGESEQVAESLGVSAYRPPATEEPIILPGLPRQHLLGSGPELSERVVMTIKTGDLPPMSAEQATFYTPPAYYWRAITFDEYTGNGWQTSATFNYVYEAGEPALEELPPASSSLRILNQQVEYAQDVGGLLYVAGELITADRNYKVAWRLPIDQGADPYGITLEASTYRAQSLLSSPSIPQLQQSGQAYPEWLLQRYLQIPEGLPARLRRLAVDLTINAATPYDEAQAIEDYLRTFEYSLDVPPAPPERDVADYFLFDLGQGYCDYYATAMVVLARLSGLPARLAVGYASGSYDPVNARYIVSEADAHSWAEIYFPNLGWVAFEPTAGRPRIDRSTQDTATIALPELKPAEGFSLAEWLGTLTWMSWVKLAFWVVGAGLLLWWFGDLPRLRSKPPAAAIGLLYLRLRSRSQRLAGTQTGDTPYQHNARLQQRIDRLPNFGYALLASILPDVARLTDIYARAAYSPVQPDRYKRSIAIQSWKNMRFRLWLADSWLRLRARLSKN